MKKLSSKLVFLKFAVLYCIIFCGYSNDAHASNRLLSKTTGSSYLASDLTDATDFYCHTIHTGMGAGNTILSRFKNSTPGFGDLVNITYQDHRLKFSSDIFSSRNHLIRLRKNNIIFPFHYFW